MADLLDPRPLIELIAAQIPADLHPHILIVGSLAAAYHHRDALGQRGVNTKDADLIVRPAGAVEECRRIAERLLEAGWVRHAQCWPSLPGTPVEELRAIRLQPSDGAPYFIELMAFPASGQHTIKAWTPCELADGLYGLPSFRFMGVTGLEIQHSDAGLCYAHPAVMALSNLLSHPRIGPETMSAPIGDRVLRRASKDLGRVLALAWLAGREGTEAWAHLWTRALAEVFPEEASTLATSLGGGLRELLADPGLLEEARHAAEIGLLSGQGVTAENLEAVGEQLFVDLIEPVRRAFASGS